MKRLRTLIVDDEPLAIERLQILSADHPMIEIVGTANDGVEALRIAQTLTPDLIFLDIVMPKMDGINAAHERVLKSDVKYRFVIEMG
jgi:two-component system response regulator AlgR